jgi:hypothetical protein
MQLLVTPQILEKTWHKTEHCLDMLATSGAYVETVQFFQTHSKPFMSVLLCFMFVCNAVNTL